MAPLTDRFGPRPLDAVTRVFVIGMAVAALATVRSGGEWPWLLACDALALLLLELVRRAPRASRVAALAALWYPFVLVPAYYGQLGIVGAALGHVRDLVVQRWELALFGSQPSVAWHVAMPAPALSWLLHACYLCHYPIIVGVPLWLWLRAGGDAAERAIFGIALAFYACFLVSAVFPVAGPGYWFPAPDGPGSRVATARLVHWVIDSGSSYGTAFPSSHVAASWTAVLMATRRAPGLAAVLAPVALGLAAGTVYGQFHYAVDAGAGAIVALACWAGADALRTRLAPRASPR